MKEKIICITTPQDRTYYKATVLAKEFFDKDKNVVHNTGTLPDGEVCEFGVSSVSIKHLAQGKLHGKLEVINLNTQTVTFSEEYDNGTLVKVSKNEPEKKPVLPALEGTIVKSHKGTHSFYVNGKEVAEETLSSTGATVELLGNIPDGEVKEVDDNNNIKATAYYKNNKLNGLLTRFTDEGKVLLKETYVDGVLQGKAAYVSYQKDNFLCVSCAYKNGLLEGERTVTDKTGIVREKAIYEHGHLQGEHTTFYSDGQRQSKAQFKEGKLHGERIFFFPSGHIWYRENYANGKLEGPRTAYFENGTLYEEETYSDNLLDGPRKVYSPQGELLINEEYHWGSLVRNTERSKK